MALSFPFTNLSINYSQACTPPPAGVPDPPQATSLPPVPPPLQLASTKLKGNQWPDFSGAHLVLHLIFDSSACQRQEPLPLFQNLLLRSTIRQAGQKL